MSTIKRIPDYAKAARAEYAKRRAQMDKQMKEAGTLWPSDRPMPDKSCRYVHCRHIVLTLGMPAATRGDYIRSLAQAMAQAPDSVLFDHKGTGMRIGEATFTQDAADTYITVTAAVSMDII